MLAWLQEEALPWFCSETEATFWWGDRGYRGAILHLAGEFLKTEIDEATIRCGAGAMLSAVSRSAMEAGLTGGICIGNPRNDWRSSPDERGRLQR